jgi:hypothetical protein
MKRDEWLLIYLSLPAKISSDLNDPIRIMKGLFLFKMAFTDKLEDF